VRHIRLILQYDGTNYSGWQVQRVRTPERIVTIQGVLEDAIERVTARRSRVTGASRTDAGVHALGQVASFKTNTTLDTETLRRALNANLPPDIRIMDVSEVDEDFHPRYSAIRKVYSYLISYSNPPSPFLGRYTWQIYHDLSGRVDLMREAADYLVGEHDFSCFRASGCASKNPVRTIYNINISLSPCFEFFTFRLDVGLLKITIEANAFLRHMARNIVGTLVEIGKGRLSPSYIRDILDSRDRRRAGITAPACGLFLERVIFNQPR
jgi:tRNA pseudouridine38-40 synthase